MRLGLGLESLAGFFAVGLGGTTALSFQAERFQQFQQGRMSEQRGLLRMIPLALLVRPILAAFLPLGARLRQAVSISRRTSGSTPLQLTVGGAIP